MDYSKAELNSMRMDAMRRTREMHSKAVNENFPAKEQKEEKKAVQAEISSVRKETSGTGFLENLLPGIQIDSDRLIIIILIVILAKEGADLKLLLALLYIML